MDNVSALPTSLSVLALFFLVRFAIMEAKSRLLAPWEPALDWLWEEEEEVEEEEGATKEEEESVEGWL